MELSTALQEARAQIISVKLDHHTLAQAKWDLMRAGEIVSQVVV